MAAGARLIRYTLRAMRRGDHVRGQQLTTPEGSDLDRSLATDPGWSRAIVKGPRAGTPGASARVEQAYALTLDYLRRLARLVAALTPAERRAFGDMLRGNAATLDPLYLAAFGRLDELAVEPVATDHSSNGAAGSPATASAPAQREDPTVGAATVGAHLTLEEFVLLLQPVIDGSDSQTPVSDLVDAARRAGLSLPGKLPTKRDKVAALLFQLATADPSDLGE